VAFIGGERISTVSLAVLSPYQRATAGLTDGIDVSLFSLDKHE